MKPEDLIATRIVQAEGRILGKLAWEIADKVYGVHADYFHQEVHITGQVTRTLKELVGRFAELFGPLARQDCRDAAEPYVKLLPPELLPAVLKNIPKKTRTAPKIGLQLEDLPRHTPDSAPR